MLHLSEVSFILILSVFFCKKSILAESPSIQRRLIDQNSTTNTNESEQEIIIANGNKYFKIYPEA